MLFKGTIQHGTGTGKKLGFPTANIPLNEPFSGIYAARVRVEGREYAAAAYADAKRKFLEAHLLDFEGDLYGKEIEIELVGKLRDDITFADEKEARETITEDVQKARAYFRMP